MSSADFQNTAKTQVSNLRRRVNSIAKAVIRDKWEEIHIKYKPRVIRDENQAWKELSRKQDTLMTLTDAAKRANDNGEAKYNVILKVRKAFPDIAKDYDLPEKPAAMVDAEAKAEAKHKREMLENESTTAQVQPNSSNCTPESSKPQVAINHESTTPPPTTLKRELVELEDDNVDDADYDPIKDAGPANRAERAVKRQRIDDFATRSRKSDDLDDLNMHLQEIDMKSGLQKLQIQRSAKAKPNVDKEDVELQLKEVDMKAELQKLQVNRKLAALKKKATEK